MKYTHFPRQVFDRDKHTDITELIHPLTSSKPVSREEIQKALSESAPEYQLEDLLKRILENGVK